MQIRLVVVILIIEPIVSSTCRSVLLLVPRILQLPLERLPSCPERGLACPVATDHLPPLTADPGRLHQRRACRGSPAPQAHMYAFHAHAHLGGGHALAVAKHREGPVAHMYRLWVTLQRQQLLAPLVAVAHPFTG